MVNNFPLIPQRFSGLYLSMVKKLDVNEFANDNVDNF